MKQPSGNHRQRLFASAAAAFSLILPFTSLSQSQAVAAGGVTQTLSGQVVRANASSYHDFGPTGLPPGTVNVDVGVWQGGTASNRQTMLYYDVYTLQGDPISGIQYVSLESGFGAIPSSAVQATGGARPSSVTLTIDTSKLNAPSFQRSIGAGGLISLTWTSIPEETWANSGSSQGTFGYDGHELTWVTAGGNYNSSAAAYGTVLGYAMPDSSGASQYGSVGSSQGMSLCRGCPPPTP
jgi:hypothetical protein